jgi:peptidoglycan hydrolase-like protein with peptidoglycan-binding domain
MQRIIAPLQSGDRGPAVANLQDALQLFLDRGIFLANDAGTRQELSTVLRRERAEQSYQDATRKLVSIFQEEQQIQPQLEFGNIDERTAEAMNRLLQQLTALNESERFVVRGILRLFDNTPIPEITIRAFDRDLRSRELLGQATTNSDGYYEIFYTRDQFIRAEKQTADLIVAAVQPIPAAVEQYRTLVESPTLFNAPNEATVDLEAGADILQTPSEYVRLIQTLDGLLADITLANNDNPTLIDKLADLNDEDLDFLFHETNIELEKLQFLVQSARLHQQFSRQDYTVPVPALYGLARTKQLNSFEGFARTSLSELKTGLAQAGGIPNQPRENIIAHFESEEQLNQIIETIHSAAISNTLNSPIGNNQPALTQVLAAALPLIEQQQILLQTYANHEGTTEQFWDTLQQQADFQEPGQVEKIQFALQLNTLTQSNVALAERLQTQFQSTRSLAQMNPDNLTTLIKEQAAPADFPGDTPEEKLNLYSQSIVGLLQGAFPTETIANVVANVAETHFNSVAPTVIAQFLNRATDSAILSNDEVFDIRSTHVDRFVALHGDRLFADIAGDRTQITQQVKRAQRLFQVSTSPETFKNLIESNFSSANQIAKQSLRTLQEKLGDQIPDEELELIHSRAIATSAASLHTAIMAYQSGTDIVPAAIGSGLKEVPNWANLFGSLELCECQHCRSLYSPAAYFVDLLEFLRNAPPNTQGWTPLDILVGNDDNPNRVLPGKRPDLPHIPLTCENTNTPIPYIDLVNEVLESYVAFGKLDHTTAKDTGLSTAAELSANPQHVVKEAYDRLRNATFPIRLPFDRSLEMARLYLEHLGSTRHQVMQAFAIDANRLASEALHLSEKEFEIFTERNFKAESVTIPLSQLYTHAADNLTPTLAFDPNAIPSGSAVVILQAKLKVDDPTVNLSLTGRYDDITRAAVIAFQQKVGLPNDGIVDADDWAVLEPLRPNAIGALIAGVPEFLSRTELSYVELVELLKTRFINPNQRSLVLADEFLKDAELTNKDIRTLIANNFANPTSEIQAKLTKAGITLEQIQALIEPLRSTTIVLYAEGSECELNKTLIQYLDGNSLTDADAWKLQRFIRLWRKLGWTMPELDSALLSLGYADSTPVDCLQKLAQLKQLQTELNITLPKLLSLWSDIETHGEKPLYKILFQNKAVLNPLDADFSLNETQDELADPTKALVDKQPAILAALRVKSSDLDAIITDAQLPSDRLNLSNLSVLHRYAMLAKTLRMAVLDLIALKRLAGNTLNPFTPRDPAPTLAFIQLAQTIQSSGFLVPQLNYLYRHQIVLPSKFPPQPPAVETLLKTLRDGLSAITQDNELPSILNSELTRTKLGILFPSELVDIIIQLIEGTNVPVLNDFPIEIANLLTNFLSDLTEAKAELIDKPSLNAEGQPLLIGADGNPTTNAEAAVTTVITAKYRYLLDKFLPYLKGILSQNLVQQILSQALNLDDAILKLLLTETKILQANQGSDQMLLADFLALGGLATGQALPSDTTTSYERLYKVAMLVNTFGFTAAEVKYWFSLDFKGFNLNTLPLAASDTPVLFEEWKQLAAYISLRNSLPQGVTTLIDVFRVEDSQKRDRLSELTGWRKVDIEQAIDSIGLKNAWNDVLSPFNLLKIQHIIGLSQTIGVSVNKLNSWATEPADSAEASVQATEIKNAAKAKYTEEAWLEISKPLSDKLRESQKAALIAYVLSIPDIRKANVTDSNRLFEYFLIDVEMCACMNTSRIKQAISSVQLFVQRCLLNLEPGVSPIAIDGDRWQWMKNYRVREANLKVFFYPENWIEPELRDNKSPFFKELESELLQTDVTNEAAEKALLNYLYKLEQVGRLEVCGMYLQEELDGKYRSVLHVFARTMGGAVRNYYYRRLLDNKEWTPLEKVELDINGVQGSSDTRDNGIHLLPVVWNRRLYLFWLIFTQKAEPAQESAKFSPDQEIEIKPPNQYWEIKLAWSKYEQGKWTQKQISNDFIGRIYPNDDPKYNLFPRSSFKLRALFQRDGLSLDLRRYDTFRRYGTSGESSWGGFHLDDSSGKVSLKTTYSHLNDEVSPKNSTSSFMGYEGKLALDIASKKISSTSILKQAVPYQLHTLNQNYFYPLQPAYFYQDGQHVYFVRSREAYEAAVSQIANPKKNYPFSKKIVKFKLEEHLPMQESDWRTEKFVVNPWVVAEEQLITQKLSAFTTQSGSVLNP